MAVFPGAVAADSDLYVAVNQKNTTLTSSINNSTLTIPVNSTTGFPSSGFITIDSEIIHYTSVGASQFNADLRGADSTSAASHSNLAFVYHNIVSAHHNALKNEIEATEQFISDLIGRTSTQVKAPNGTVSLPGISFASSTNTGLYQSGNSILFAANGTSTAQMTNDAFYPLFHVRGINGTASNPTYTFDSETNTGIYRASAGDMGFTVGGSLIVEVTATKVIFAQPILIADGTVSAPGLVFGSNQTTGIYKSGSNQLAIALNGTAILDTNSSGLYPKQPIKISVDGTISAPAYSFDLDTDTGIYRVGSNDLAVVIGGAKAAEFVSTGDTAGTGYTPLQLGNALPIFFDKQYTHNITNTATTFITISNDAGMVLVMGGDSGGSNQFIDLLLCSGQVNPQVVSSFTAFGSPAARTYTHTGSAIKVSFASGTYHVNAIGMTPTRPNS